MRERSIGLGAMGFHAYLQKNSIPFESGMAMANKYRNVQAHKKVMQNKLLDNLQ